MTPTTPPNTLPRGIRNKNPGNIRHSARFIWVDELAPDAEGFCRFPDPVWGLRPMIVLFHNYQELAHLSTVEDMIARWAPDNENDSTDYARYVAGRLQVAPQDPIDFMEVWREFTRAIVSYENGQDPYTPDQYTDAFGHATTR